jgi:hypothetical protein
MVVVDEGLIAWQSSYFEYKIKREICCFKKMQISDQIMKPILLLTTAGIDTILLD